MLYQFTNVLMSLYFSSLNTKEKIYLKYKKYNIYTLLTMIHVMHAVYNMFYFVFRKHLSVSKVHNTLIQRDW